MKLIGSRNTQVLGISIDSVPSAVAYAEKLGGLSYPKLADFHPQGKVAAKYGILRKEGFSKKSNFCN